MVSSAALEGFIRGEYKSPLWSTAPKDLIILAVEWMPEVHVVRLLCASEEFAEIEPDETITEWQPLYGVGMDKPDSARWTIPPPEEDLTRWRSAMDRWEEHERSCRFERGPHWTVATAQRPRNDG
jgi:hypothetical protein